MAKVIGKIPLLSTNIRHFKAIQGIDGKTLFDRYKLAESNVIGTYIPKEYQHFLAYPVKNGEEITFYGKINKDVPELLSELKNEKFEKYERIKKDTLHQFNKAIDTLQSSGKKAETEFLSDAIKYIDDRFVYCYDDTVVLGVWGMQMRENQRVDIWQICINHAELDKKGPEPDEQPQQNHPPPTPQYSVNFSPGEHGSLRGEGTLYKESNAIVSSDEMPKIAPDEGYEFTGWSEDPNGYQVTGNKHFFAQYKEKESLSPPITPVPPPPWYIRLWNWIKTLLFDRGCLKWLLWFLLILLLLLLLSWLFKGCNDQVNTGGGTAIGDNDSSWVRDDPRVGDGGGIYDPGNPYTPVPTPPDYEGILPPQQGVLPPMEDNPEIKPGNPTIIANRLNILMENEDKTIMDLAKQFKEKYPAEKYKVVYYDNVVKRMQIEVPAAEREQLKKDIPQQFAPEFNLFVFDESLFESRHVPNDPVFKDADKSWYFKAINAMDAWDVSMGSEKVVVAIVDNGFDLKHPELSSKVVQPYNVWKHSKDIFPLQIDHGTHVAGTALAFANNGKGISGIAPNCKFMPIQVANEKGMMTTTSVLDGILYALYQGADVVNVSLGSQFTGLSQFPENTQRELIQNHFKEEERLWREIMRIAAKHNATVVVAAGNDNVLAGIDAIQRPELFITVSAVDKLNSPVAKAPFSNFGKYSTISAPGVGIYSTVGSNGYEMMDGTSMAAPIVAGAVALMKSVNPSITTKQIICVLQATGKPANGNIGKMLQLDKALKMIKSGAIPDCQQTPSTGDVQILLKWNNYNDLDLICTDPLGETVFYKNRQVSSGGQLEIDMNVEYPDSKQPIENIYWTNGSAPKGNYKVYILYFKKHESSINETPYDLTIKYGTKVETFSGKIKAEDGALAIYSFNLGNNRNNEENNNSTNGNSMIPDNHRKERLIKKRDSLRKVLNQVENEINHL